MLDYKINLQLFADDSGVGDINTAPAGDTSVPEGGENYGSDTSVNTGTESTNSEGGFAITVNPHTGAREIVPYNQGENNEQESAHSDDQEELDPGENNGTEEIPLQGPKPYTVEELTLAAQLGQIDETRIPPEYIPQYIAYKQSQMQAHQIQQQPQQEVEQKQTPQQQYEMLRQLAVQRTLQELGMTEEDVASLEYNEDEATRQRFNMALQANANKILFEVQQQQMQEQQVRSEQVAIINDIKSYVHEQMQSEPNWNAIDQMMKTRYQELPYKEAKVIAETIDNLQKGTIKREQLAILEQYYKDTREAFYAKQNNLSKNPQKRAEIKKPPVVENAGNGLSMEGDKGVDWSQMRNMSSKRERMDFLIKNFRR